VVVTSSGAGGALVADVASDHGLHLAGSDGEWPQPAASALHALGTAGRIRNPIDLGTLGDWRLLSNVFRAIGPIAAGPTIVYAHNAPQERMGEQLADALIERKAQTTTPVIVLAPGALRPAIEARLNAAGIPVFRDTAAAFEGLTAFIATAPPAGAAPVAHAEPPRAASDGTAARLLAGGVPLSETQSAELLRGFGLPVVESVDVRSTADAQRAAETLGYPLVLKALAPGVAHKHAAGFVVVGIATPTALEHEMAALEARVAAAGYARADVPFVLQPMLRGACELIAGVSWEATLGHFLVYGLGGIYAEAFDEVTLLPVPVDPATVRASIAASRVGRVLAAIERRPGVLVDALADALAGLQAFVAAHGEQVASVDVNPLLASADGLIAVDALIVPR
jgi:acyl-CoA synthetase (NDP forming)